MADKNPNSPEDEQQNTPAPAAGADVPQPEEHTAEEQPAQPPRFARIVQVAFIVIALVLVAATTILADEIVAFFERLFQGGEAAALFIFHPFT